LSVLFSLRSTKFPLIKGAAAQRLLSRAQQSLHRLGLSVGFLGSFT
jgi:hypothetical protein